MVIYFNSKSANYSEFSNFYKSRIRIYDMEFASAEHFYHWCKPLGKRTRARILRARTPEMARRIAKFAKYDLDAWKTQSVQAMRMVIREKFKQNRDLRKLLHETNGEELIHISKWDSFWGCGADQQGQNMLGKILMEFREEDREEFNTLMEEVAKNIWLQKNSKLSSGID